MRCEEARAAALLCVVLLSAPLSLCEACHGPPCYL